MPMLLTRRRMEVAWLVSVRRRMMGAGVLALLVVSTQILGWRAYVASGAIQLMGE